MLALVLLISPVPSPHVRQEVSLPGVAVAAQLARVHLNLVFMLFGHVQVPLEQADKLLAAIQTLHHALLVVDQVFMLRPILF